MLLAQTPRNPAQRVAYQASLWAESEKQSQNDEEYGLDIDSYQQRRDSAVSLSPPLVYIHDEQHTPVVPRRLYSSSLAGTPVERALPPHRFNKISPSLFPSYTSVQNVALGHSSCQPTAAMDQVIATPELLEQILLSLDQRSLLTSCLRVNKTWQSLIDTSPSLQRHLFLRAASPRFLNCHRTPTVNPLLSWGFPNWFDGTQYPERVDVKTGVRSRPRDSRTYFDFETNPAEQFYALPWARNPDAWRRKEASWRRMEITQQPTRVLHVRAALDTYGERADLTGTAHFLATEKSGSGLRMGAVYDFLVKRMENFHFSSTPGDWVCDEGKWQDGDGNSLCTCKSMTEPCHMHESNWCMQLHVYQPFVVDHPSFGGRLGASKFKSEGAMEPFQVFSVENGQKL